MNQSVYFMLLLSSYVSENWTKLLRDKTLDMYGTGHQSETDGLQIPRPFRKVIRPTELHGWLLFHGAQPY
jgi:hypothetical protein